MSKDNKNTKGKKKSGTSKRVLASATKETKAKVARKGGKASQSSGKNKKQIDTRYQIKTQIDLCKVSELFKNNEI